MIFVILGTQTVSFNRLTDKIIELIKNNTIKDEVIIQSGYTKITFEHNLLSYYDYLDSDTMHEYQNKADIIITHGGVGTILECVKLNKKIIAVPRLKEFNEHINDHQLEIVEMYANRKYLLPLFHIEEIENVLKNILEFRPAVFISNNKRFLDEISLDIDKLLK